MHACKQIVEMNHFSRVVAACISLTFVGCLLAAVVHAVPASAHPVIDSELGDGNSDPIPGDEEQINVNEEDVNDGLFHVNYFGGDIILTPEQKAMIIEGSQQSSADVRRAVQRTQSVLWRDGKVPYVLDRTLSSRARSTIANAIQTYEQGSCVRFVQRTSEADYIRFFKGRGCYSYVGKTGGAQKISIGSGCERTGIVMHEMFHALGRWHEQSRPDRDQYIRIIYNNIRSGTEHNFMKLSNTTVSTQDVPYDTKSIMHYGAYSFSRNGKPTIEPQRQPGVSTSANGMGQRIRLTSQDLQHINRLYGCEQSEGSTGGISTWSPWGSWSACNRTCNGGTQTRTRTCTGIVPCVGTNTQEQQCNTQPCSVPAYWGTWSSWSGCSVTCGGGRQTRSRTCLNGNTCTGQGTQSRDCNTQNCPLRYHPVGCYELVIAKSRALRTLGRFHSNAVQNCANRMQLYGYTRFAVIVGYCISGSNNAADYNAKPSTQCANGQGRFIRGKYHMSMYMITSTSQSGDVADDEYGSVDIGSLTLGPLPMTPSSPPAKLNPPQQTVHVQSGSACTAVNLYCILILLALALIITVAAK